VGQCSLLASIQIKLLNDRWRQPVAPDGGDEFAGTLFKLGFREAMSGRFADHHQDAGTELLDVAGEEKRLAYSVVSGDGAMRVAQTLRGEWRGQFARIPNLDAVSKN